MKTTVILLAALCVLVGAIVGWGLKGRFVATGQAAMIDITPPELTDAGNSRFALYNGKSVTVVEYWRTGEIDIKGTRKIK